MGILNNCFLEAISKTIEESGVDLTEEEIEDIAAKAVQEALPKVIEDIHRELHRDAPEMLFWRRRFGRGFRERLLHRWQAGFDLLEMLGVICLETGEIIVRDTPQGLDESERPRFEALMRLHARACLTFEEIVCLLKNGYADGALARWRALHEIATVAMFIAESPVEVSIRFLEHRHIECWGRMQKYQEYSERCGFPPYSKEEMDNAKAVAESLKERHGKGYAGDYGWATISVQGSKPTFAEIESRVGVDHLRPYYKWACERIHASCNGLYRTLGLMNEEDVMLAGPSDAGLADPAQLAAISLLHATRACHVNLSDIDLVVASCVAGKVMTKVCDTFARIQQELEEEKRLGQTDDVSDNSYN